MFSFLAQSSTESSDLEIFLIFAVVALVYGVWRWRTRFNRMSEREIRAAVRRKERLVALCKMYGEKLFDWAKDPRKRAEEFIAWLKDPGKRAREERERKRKEEENRRIRRERARERAQERKKEERKAKDEERKRAKKEEREKELAQERRSRGRNMVLLDKELYSEERKVLQSCNGPKSFNFYVNGKLNPNYFDGLNRPYSKLPWRAKNYKFPLCYLVIRKGKQPSETIYKIGYTTQSQRIDYWYQRGFRQLVHIHTPYAETLEHYLIDHYRKAGLCPHPRGEELIGKGWDESLCQVAKSSEGKSIQEFDLKEFVNLAKDRMWLWKTGEVLPRFCAEEGCDRPFYAKGLCSTHYNKNRKENP